MVIVKLMGGLGNQMFQYAMARRVADKHRVPLKLDISWYDSPNNDTPRVYELNRLNIVEQFATSEEVAGFKTPTGIRKLVSAFRNEVLPYYKRPYIKEMSARFDPHVLELPAHVYIEGFWGCEKYFSDIRDRIRREFTLRGASSEINEQTAELIRGVESVSIHIRRGDYITNAATNRFHGVCSLNYYHAAIGMIAKELKRPHLFVFSDDQEWVKQNLRVDYMTTYVSHNDPDTGHEDMRLMSLCRHNIIANSTFSWWGAWLNQNPNKRVIAPIKWFNDDSIETVDLIPDSWVRL